MVQWIDQKLDEVQARVEWLKTHASIELTQDQVSFKLSTNVKLTQSTSSSQLRIKALTCDPR